MIILVSIISFFLEFLINYIFDGSIFLGLIVFSTIIFLEPFFKKNKGLFMLYCFIMGFCYDLVYTGFYFMNAGLFLIIGCVVLFINDLTPNNLFVSILELVLLICFYRFISFLFLVINGVVPLRFDLLFESIYCSFLINILYGFVLYLFLCFISRFFNIRRIS